MPKKRFSEEQIVTLLRQIEVSMAQGNAAPVACREAGISTMKPTYRYVKEMNWDMAEDYLYAKAQEANSTDPEQGRKQGMKKFRDAKSFKPGLSEYRREEELDRILS